MLVWQFMIILIKKIKTMEADKILWKGIDYMDFNNNLFLTDKSGNESQYTVLFTFDSK